jgi:hypothetical protein
MQTVQQLSEEDREDRMTFARDELERIEDDPDHLPNLFFSDEAHFHLHGGVNWHNFRYWSDENPDWYSENPLHSPRTTVWAAMGEMGIIGPIFFEGNVKGASYLQVLQNEFWLEIQRFANHENIRFMQNGAPSHFAREVRT